MLFDDKRKINLINEGVFYTEAQEYDRAIECFDEILAQDPYNSAALNNKGAILLAKGDFAEALTLINAGLDKNPQNPEGWVNKALCLYAMSKTQSALECCDKALKLKPLYNVAWENKCLILNQVRQFEKALEVANEALENGIVSSTIFLKKGYALYYLGRFSVALLNFNSALFLDPDNEIAKTFRIKCIDTIAQMSENLRNNELIYKNKIDERYLPKLNQVFSVAAGDHIVYMEKIMTKGFERVSSETWIPEEKITRINKINCLSLIPEIVDSNSKLLVLCGSGISFDSPSNLPTGRQFIEGLVKAIIPPSYDRDQLLSDVSKVPSYKAPLLGFEGLLQIIQEYIDDSLHILNIFSFCNIPNRNHLFLAEMIKRGHFVITTNFDILIEKAFQRLFPDEMLQVMITDEDFRSYTENPSKYKYVLFKLHGSLALQSGQDVRETIKATLFQVGKGGFMFGSEPHKKEVLENLLKTHPLVVLGYSGYDEVDFVSLLTETKSIQKTIWINHKKSGSTSAEGLTRCEFILARMKDDIQKQSRFFLYNGLTSEVVDTISNYKLSNSEIATVEATLSDLKKMSFKMDESQYFTCWRNRFISNKPCSIPAILSASYHYLEKPKETKFYAEDALRILPFKAKDTQLELSLHNNLGIAYESLGNNDKCSDHMKKALEISENIGDFYNATTICTNIGVFLAQQHKDEEAQKYADLARSYSKRIEEDPLAMGQLLTLLGGLAYRRSEFDISRKYFETSEMYRNKTGDLRGLVVTYSWLAETLARLGDGKRAMYYQAKKAQLEKAIKSGDIMIEMRGLR